MNEESLFLSPSPPRRRAHDVHERPEERTVGVLHLLEDARPIFIA
jgi:hypothetical protein